MRDDNDLLRLGLLDRDNPLDGCHEWRGPPEENNGEAAHQTRVTLTDPSRVPLANVTWLWPGYFSRGHLAQFSARYGTGKSTVAVDVSCRVIQGGEYPLGGGRFEPGRVLYCHPDEPAADVRRRFFLAGLSDSEMSDGLRLLANRSDAALLSLRSLFWLESALEQWPADLVWIDTLGDLDLEGDLQKPGPGKAVTAALARVAERTGACIVALGHTVKGQGHNRHDAVYGAGSVPGSFRAAYVVRQRAPDDPDADEASAPSDYGVFCLKSTYTATRPAPFGFTIGGVDLDGIEGGVVAAWRSSPGFREDESLDFPRQPKRWSFGEVVNWLRAQLRPGPAWVTVVGDDAPDEVTAKLLRRAREKLKVRKKKIGKPWAMYLPHDAAAEWSEEDWRSWAAAQEEAAKPESS